MTAYGSLVLNDGMTVLAWSCALVLLWVMGNWGLDKGLSLVFPHHDRLSLSTFPNRQDFRELAFLVYLLNHYMVNFPFVGFSFHNFRDGDFKTRRFAFAQSANNQTDILMQYLQTPSTLITAPLNPLAVVDGLIYLLVHCWAGFVSFGMFVLGGLGFVLSGVFLVVVGPIIFVLWMFGGVPASGLGTGLTH